MTIKKNDQKKCGKVPSSNQSSSILQLPSNTSASRTSTSLSFRSRGGQISNRQPRVSPEIFGNRAFTNYNIGNKRRSRKLLDGSKIKLPKSNLSQESVPSSSKSLNYNSTLMFQANRPTQRRNRVHQISNAQQNQNCNSEDEHESQENFDFEVERKFAKELKEKLGYKIIVMGDDGACMFRAVAHQVYGSQNDHDVVRKNCMNYIEKNEDHFRQYIAGETFSEYITRKRRPYEHGNHLEIQAMAEMYCRVIEVYDCNIRPEKIGWTSNNNEDNKHKNIPIRISRHNKCHYNSVVDPSKPSFGCGLGMPGLESGDAADKRMMEKVKQDSMKELEQKMLEDKLLMTGSRDVETTEEEMIRRAKFNSLESCRKMQVMQQKKKFKNEERTIKTSPLKKKSLKCRSFLKHQKTPETSPQRFSDNSRVSFATSSSNKDSNNILSSFQHELASTSAQHAYNLDEQSDWVDDTNEEEVVKKLLFQTKHEQIVLIQQEYDLKKLQESSERSESNETASASCSKYPTS